MWRSVERLVACPVLLMLGGLELIAALFSGLAVLTALHGHINSGPQPHPGWTNLLLAATTLFCLVLAAWAIATVAGMNTGKAFTRISMRLLGAVHAVIGFCLLLLSIFEEMRSPAVHTATNPLLYSLATLSRSGISWLACALIAIGLWWLVSFRTPLATSCRL